jgi:hypothetical protein
MFKQGGTPNSEPLTLNDFRSSTTATADERRREPRTSCDKRIAIWPYVPTKDQPHQIATLFDCSPHGVGLLTDQPMTAGDQFLVELRLEAVSLVLYTVRHCRRADGGAYKVGAAFTGIVSGPCDAEAREVFDALLNAARK